MISAVTSNPLDTKTKILNAAEKLFGMNGFDGTSLRDITAEAQDNLAAVNYHFQSKDSLIDAIIERRIEPINRSRFEMLDAAGPSPTVEKIVEAFLLPLLMVEVRAAVPMLGRVLSNPDQFVERVYKKHLLPVVERFYFLQGRMPATRFISRAMSLSTSIRVQRCWPPPCRSRELPAVVMTRPSRRVLGSPIRTMVTITGTIASCGARTWKISRLPASV